jgi:hypothetical protein
MEDGQFSECDLTLSDIDRIAYSFLETLSSYYHGRIVYPGFDFKPALSRRRRQAPFLISRHGIRRGRRVETTPLSVPFALPCLHPFECHRS